MHVEKTHRHLLFPTPIWQFMFEGCEELNEEIYRDVVSFDWEGYKRAHNLDFGDDLSSRAEDTFIPIDRALSLLHVLKFAADCAAEAGAEYGWDLENHRLEVTEFWANINRLHDHNMRHNHVPNHLSGVYYVKVPEGSGDIRFFDDRKVRTATEPAPVRESVLASRSYTVRPTAGMMLIFPSWLDHIVGQNKTNEIRVSISFNIDLVKPNRHVAPGA